MRPSMTDLYEASHKKHSDIETVYEESAQWKHGQTFFTVFRRISDDTFWRVVYDVSYDLQTHNLRDGDASVARVFPRQVTKTIYEIHP